MKTLIRNLLPQDTRSVEFPSAVGLIICSIMLFFNLIPNVYHIGFWCVVTFMLGVVYIVSLLHFPKLDCCRPVLSWLAGSFWIWLTFSQPLSIMAIPVFFLGVSNIVAFLINTVILSETWRP
jgi:hypothetical protein